MPGRQTVEDLIAMVEAGQFDTAIARFYADDASMQENLDPPRHGLAKLVEGERRTMARSKNIRAQCVRPYLIDHDLVVIRWLFEFEQNDGCKIVLDEIAYQHWRGEKIAKERFYYDPKQLGR